MNYNNVIISVMNYLFLIYVFIAFMYLFGLVVNNVCLK